MKANQAEHAAQIFRQQSLGYKLSNQERNFLQGLLDNMETPERAGAMAAIIRIMLDIK